MKRVVVSGVRTVETHWIPMADGRRLAARLFLPVTAGTQPVPLILEYIPYRRRDGTRLGDDEMHLWFAANGFACARVDIAGTGDSDGIVEDEYVKREQDDALEIIEHLCREPWCTGAAGMIGISWGGFNSLQVAARRPPRLKCIVTICSTDDRYAIDAHYNGGCVINDNFGWGGAFFNYAALPPDPAVVGEDRWRDLWRQRLDNHAMFPGTWLKHQRRDAYWKHGSVCEDFSAIECPVLAVGGFLDGYTPAIFNLVENLDAVCKGIVGPWGHKEPQRGVPGPAIGFLQECKRWFGHWLKGEDTGADTDPAMRLYLMEPAKPVPHFLERTGRWLGFPQWPAPGISPRRLHLGRHILAQDPVKGAAPLSISSPLTTGLAGQEWCPYGQGRIAPEGATDQRPDDAGSLCFDSEPFDADVNLVGCARLTLRIAADRPQAMVAARLNSIAPDGSSALVTFALLNLTHRDSHEHPTPLLPGEFVTAELVMKPVAQTLPKGHRLRIALSSSYWPMAWPSPQAVTLTVDPSGSVLELPLLAGESGLVPAAFEESVFAEAGPVTVKIPGVETRIITHDIGAERTEFAAVSDDGRFVHDEIGTEITSFRKKTYSISGADPASCKALIACHEEFLRDDWNARVDTEISVSCDKKNFHMRGWVRAYERGQLFAERTYDETIPRDCM
ncbi:CocE/NonD family hydrolase [soil metagenome]